MHDLNTIKRLNEQAVRTHRDETIAKPLVSNSLANHSNHALSQELERRGAALSGFSVDELKKEAKARGFLLVRPA